jgi:hypothetical protein
VPTLRQPENMSVEDIGERMEMRGRNWSGNGRAGRAGRAEDEARRLWAIKYGRERVLVGSVVSGDGHIRDQLIERLVRPLPESSAGARCWSHGVAFESRLGG